jgi:hypothetical protein
MTAAPPQVCINLYVDSQKFRIIENCLTFSAMHITVTLVRIIYIYIYIYIYTYHMKFNKSMSANKITMISLSIYSQNLKENKMEVHASSRSHSPGNGRGPHHH